MNASEAMRSDARYVTSLAVEDARVVSRVAAPGVWLRDSIWEITRSRVSAADGIRSSFVGVSDYLREVE